MKWLGWFSVALLWLPAVVAGRPFDPATSTNQVGIAVFGRLRSGEPHGNLIVSPYSIESALALAYAGADGETRVEMRRVLQLPGDNASVQAGFDALRGALDQMTVAADAAAKSRREGRGEPGPVEWHVADRLFGERDYAYRDEFLALMRDGFHAPFAPMDFRRAPDVARAAINDWVADQTMNRIRDIVPPGGVTRDTRLVLVNALYLKAPWQWPFSTSATHPGDFHFADGTVRQVPMMRHSDRFGYAKENGATIVTLPYRGDALQFVIILPDPGASIDDLAQQLSAAALSRWAKLSGEPQKVDLEMPKFRVDSGTLPLARALEALGMRQAFDLPHGSANFDGIAPRRPDDYLAISDVFHRTFVAVDETGTEAAAATAVSMVGVLAYHPEKPIQVRVDRPFLFAIQHRPSGVCLFLGQVTDPRSN